MAITIGAAAQQAVQTQAQADQPSQVRSEAHSHADRDGRNLTIKTALTPAIRQAAQIVAGPLGEVAVKMAAGAVGALLDTRA